MKIDFFRTPGNSKKAFRLRSLHQLTGKEAAVIREEILQLVEGGAETVYLDATKVVHTDLSGINEVIHTNYVLANLNKKFVLAYRQESELAKWVSNTGFEQFVATAIIPA